MYLVYIILLLLILLSIGYHHNEEVYILPLLNLFDLCNNLWGNQAKWVWTRAHKTPLKLDHCKVMTYWKVVKIIQNKRIYFICLALSQINICEFWHILLDHIICTCAWHHRSQNTNSNVLSLIFPIQIVLKEFFFQSFKVIYMS